MPSFVCDKCQETLKKPKLDAHVQRCRGASFSCIDCYRHFAGTEYRGHFSCISEVEKYEKRKPGERPGKSTSSNAATKNDGRTDVGAPAGKRARSQETKETAGKDDTVAPRETAKPTNAELVRGAIAPKGVMDLKSVLKVLKKKRGISKRHLLKKIMVSCPQGGDLSFSVTD